MLSKLTQASLGLLLAHTKDVFNVPHPSEYTWHTLTVYLPYVKSCISSSLHSRRLCTWQVFPRDCNHNSETRFRRQKMPGSRRTCCLVKRRDCQIAFVVVVVVDNHEEFRHQAFFSNRPVDFVETL